MKLIYDTHLRGYRVVESDFPMTDVIEIEQTIENWYEKGVFVPYDLDYLRLRDEIKRIAIDKIGSDYAGWGILNGKEKVILASYFIVPSLLISEVFTRQQRVEKSELFHSMARKCRKVRFSRVVALIKDTLVNKDSDRILRDLSGGSHKFSVNLYIGYVECNILDVLAYISDLVTDKIVPIEGTLEKLINNIISILKHGTTVDDI